VDGQKKSKAGKSSESAKEEGRVAGRGEERRRFILLRRIS